MPSQRFNDLERLASIGADATVRPFVPQHLTHIYIKLDFDKEHENAATAAQARGFLSSVARTAVAAELSAIEYGGRLLEVQGSVLHVAMPHDRTTALEYAGRLHQILRRVFTSNVVRVQGWRMVPDSGRTLRVP